MTGTRRRLHRPVPEPDGRSRAATLGGQRPAVASGVAVAVIAVLGATVAIYPLRHVAPVVSLSVVYLLAVLLLATYWGLGLGVFTALLSAASFNFFHLRPTGAFAASSGSDWAALAAFVIVALVAGTVADLARARTLEAERRRGEADLAGRAVILAGEEIHLTPIEFSLLALLARNRGRLMTHRDLLVAVWGPGYSDDTQVLRAHIANLRRKIEPPGRDGQRYIRTDPGVGYRFAG